MRILLIGEYSRLHNSLKEGLIELGHEVIIMAEGDGFKKYPVDIKISHSFNSFILKKIKVLLYKLTSIDLQAIQIYYKASKELKKINNVDIVQLINERSIKSTPNLEIKFLKKVLKKTNKLFSLSCGVDYTCMTYMMDNIPKYSLMSPYLKDNSLYNSYKFQLEYLNDQHKKLHNFIIQNCNGVISSDFDYHLPCLYLLKNKYLGLIPNPINVNKIKFIPFNIGQKIKIFHGINSKANHKKGNHHFSEALKVINSKYTDLIEIKETTDLPYNEYITTYDDCHILLDQVYGYDQGYNALEAMAKGKVVFTGAEQEWLDHYNLQENKVVINALPNTKNIIKKLEWLILNPNMINEISLNARKFIEEHHDYKKVAKNYEKQWLTN